MKKMDLDSMSEQELLALNRDIIQRLEIYRNFRRKSQLMTFRIGDRVSFETEHGTIEGMIIRLNQKTASIDTGDGRHWRVSPGFLSKTVSGEKTKATNIPAQGSLLSFSNKKRQ